MDRPNILFIVVDCLRADALLSTGRGADTPSLDGLVRAGTAFTQMITSATLTTPAVTSMLTGEWPFAHGVRTLAGRLGRGLPLLQEILRDHGYHTIGRVTGPLSSESGLERGFSDYQWRSPREYLDTPWSDALVRDLEKAPRPWFTFLHLWELHWPRRVPSAYRNARSGSTQFNRALSALDRQLGRLFGAVPAGTIVSVTGDHGERVGGIYDETRRLVLVTADLARLGWQRARHLSQKLRLQRVARRVQHASGFGRMLHGDDLGDASIRVPWILAGASIPRGQRLGAQVRHIDMAATLLREVSVSLKLGSGEPVDLETGPAPDISAYAEATGLPGSDPRTWLSCLRSGGFKLVASALDPMDPGRLYRVGGDLGATEYLIDDRTRAQVMREALWAMAGPQHAPSVERSAEEERRVLRRLADLGYLED